MFLYFIAFVILSSYSPFIAFATQLQCSTSRVPPVSALGARFLYAHWPTPVTPWGRQKTSRHLATSTEAALKGYYDMWLKTVFSAEAKKARVRTPIRVIGGRQDLPGFQETYYSQTLAVWYPNVEFRYITDAGHYPMQGTPVYLATLIQEFLQARR